MDRKLCGFVLAALALLLSSQAGLAQLEELPLGRCDRLPVVAARVGNSNFQFLVDTGATSLLNLKSFSSGTSKDIRISSWHGTSAASAREVSIPELILGKRSLRNLKLPAIDLSAIGDACGGRIDGILGVDLLEQMGATIDFERRIATLGLRSPQNAQAQYKEMEGAMEFCHQAFDRGDAGLLEQCFDPEIILYSKEREYHGRKQVMQYLQEHLLRYAPNLHFAMKPHDFRLFGNTVWHSYEYSIETPGQRYVGHGVAMCRKNNGRWLMLNMHNSMNYSDLFVPAAPTAKPQAPRP